MRKLGILLPIFSLPSKTGIGDFGKEAYEFIDYLAEIGIKIWQILPLNPLGEGNSPYQSYSIYAIDEIYISLEWLRDQNFFVEMRHFDADTNRIDYKGVRAFKKAYLKKAFTKFKPDTQYDEFIQNSWVYNYAVFCVFKKIHNNAAWNTWELQYKDWSKAKNVDLASYEEDINYQLFLQYILYKQWFSLKQYANQKGIEIMGDIPIYAGYDSVDVWSNPKNFLLDEAGNSTYVAGVGPDYFSEKGQLWGNPLYDWEYLKSQKFHFWIERLSHSKSLYDSVRIDHFRGFDTYWKIPAQEEDARNGTWELAPGYELFDEVYRQIPDIQIVAEDLGELRKEVLELRDHYHLKGMRVLQYMFDVEEKEFNDIKNMVAYTGTHDNQTLQGWLNNQNWEEYDAFFQQHGFNNKHRYENFVEYTIFSIHDLAIIPMQDFLGESDEARMNVPGEVSLLNWSWKMGDFSKFKAKLPLIKRWRILSNR